MSKPVKEMITRELRGRYGELGSALWVEMLGVDGITTNALRRELRSRQMRLEVVKNALFRRACADTRLGRLAESLSGPSALITGGESLIDVAKLVDEWLPRVKGLRLRGAVLEGEFLDERRAGELSRMPSRKDLQARIAGLARTPGANLAAAILSAGGRIAGCVQALIEKREKGGGEAAPAA